RSTKDCAGCWRVTTRRRRPASSTIEAVRSVQTFTLAVCVSLALALAGAGPAAASDDSFFSQQWNLAQVKAEPPWSRPTRPGATIGLIATGVDSNHPDLAGKIDATANCIGGTCRPGNADDGHGHGTIVAGIAAANTNNGRGIAGVAPDAHLVIAKAVDDEGRG